MAPKTKINLKDKLEDGELDLSLSDLQEVPVREIATIKKATSLDLSNNRLTTLGKNFVTLTHIIKLDLSKNQLTELPENFGEMRQLKHLDLYSNNLTHLPLSFYQLKALKWLDLKNNQLVPAVGKVAGPCLDANQCISCARNVVSFFQQMYEQVEEEKVRREKEYQAQLEAQAALEKVHQKKKEKRKAAKAKKINKLKVEKQQEQNSIQVTVNNKEHSNKVKNHVKDKIKSTKRSTFNIYLFMIKFIFWSLLASSVFLFVFTSSKYPSAVFLKENFENIWSETVQKTPENYRIYLSTIGGYVNSVHNTTGIFVEKSIIFVDEIRKSDQFQTLTESFWKMLDIASNEVKKIFVILKDQAIFITDEIKKKVA